MGAHVYQYLRKEVCLNTIGGKMYNSTRILHVTYVALAWVIFSRETFSLSTPTGKIVSSGGTSFAIIYIPISETHPPILVKDGQLSVIQLENLYSSEHYANIYSRYNKTAKFKVLDDRTVMLSLSDVKCTVSGRVYSVEYRGVTAAETKVYQLSYPGDFVKYSIRLGYTTLLPPIDPQMVFNLASPMNFTIFSHYEIPVDISIIPSSANKSHSCIKVTECTFLLDPSLLEEDTLRIKYHLEYPDVCLYRTTGSLSLTGPCPNVTDGPPLDLSTKTCRTTIILAILLSVFIAVSIILIIILILKSNNQCRWRNNEQGQSEKTVGETILHVEHPGASSWENSRNSTDESPGENLATNLKSYGETSNVAEVKTETQGNPTSAVAVSSASAQMETGSEENQASPDSVCSNNTMPDDTIHDRTIETEAGQSSDMVNDKPETPTQKPPVPLKPRHLSSAAVNPAPDERSGQSTSNETLHDDGSDTDDNDGHAGDHSNLPLLQNDDGRSS